MKEEQKSSEFLSTFLEFTRRVKTEYHYNFSSVNLQDCAIGDFKHQIELGSYRDRNKAATQLKNALQARRAHKDFVEVNSALVEYFDGDEFQRVYKKLEQLLGVVRKNEKYIESQRVYRKRNPESSLTIKTKERN